MSSIKQVLFLVFCPLWLLKPLLAAQLAPSADTFVSASNPKLNFGTSPVLVVQPGSVVYMKFDLSSLPGSANVQRATLRIYVNALVKPGSFDVFPVLGEWSEGTLTYSSNPPELGPSATGRTIPVTSFSLNNYVLADITGLVQDWVSGKLANHGLALKLTSEGGTFSFDAREALLTGNAPELDITLVKPGDLPAKESGQSPF
jgi:hypothetical protein